MSMHMYECTRNLWGVWTLGKQSAKAYILSNIIGIWGTESSQQKNLS